MSTDTQKQDIASYFSFPTKAPSQTPLHSTVLSQSTQQSRPMADISSYFCKQPVPATLDAVGGTSFQSSNSKSLQTPVLSTVIPQLLTQPSTTLVNSHNQPTNQTPRANATTSLPQQTLPTDSSALATSQSASTAATQHPPLQPTPPNPAVTTIPTQQPQPPQNPLESFFRYSQVLQLSVQSLQSLTSHSFTLIQALLLFKSELCSFLFPSLSSRRNQPQSFPTPPHNSPHGPSTHPTLFQSLITRPLGVIFKLALKTVDFLLRIVTCNLLSITPRSPQTDHFHKHIGYPYNQHNNTHFPADPHHTTPFNTFSPSNRPIVPNATPTQHKHFQQSSTGRTLTYLLATSLVILGLIKYAPSISSALSTRYNLPNPFLTHPSSSPQQTTPLQHISPISALINPSRDHITQPNSKSQHQHHTSSLFDIDITNIDNDPAHYLTPSEKLAHMHSTGHLNPKLYEFYVNNPKVAIPDAIVAKFDPKTHSPHLLPSKSRQSQSLSTFHTPLQKSWLPGYISPNPQQQRPHQDERIIQHQTTPTPLPSLFEHVDTTTTLRNISSSGTNNNTNSAVESNEINQVKKVTFSQCGQMVIDPGNNHELSFLVTNNRAEMNYAIDQRTGQVKLRKTDAKATKGV